MTSDGEKTLTIQNSQKYKEVIHNAKKLKMTGMAGSNDVLAQSAVSPPDTYGGTDFDDVMGQFAYQEQPDLEVQDLKDWERTHLK